MTWPNRSTPSPQQPDNTGQAAVQSLLERGAHVRALVRAEDDRSAALASAGAEIAVADLFDPRTLEPALADVSGVYLAVPGTDYMLEAVAAFLVAARNQQVQSIVYSSQWLAHHSAGPRPDPIIGLGSLASNGTQNNSSTRPT